MTIQIKHEMYVVEAYHFDKRVPEAEVETEINVGITPMEAEEGANYPEEDTILGTSLRFRLVFTDYVISGSIRQVNHVVERKVAKQEDLAPQEVEKLVAPLFDIVKRLTYEVTEVALDAPGVTLNFESSLEDDSQK